MATKIKKTNNSTTGVGAGRAYVKKKQNREQNKLLAEAALRVGTFGYDAVVSNAVKKAKAKKAVK